MRTIKIVLLVVMLVGIGGCGVIMDAAHTTALNQSAAYADRMADLADSNQLTMDQAKEALNSDANQFRYFLNATVGK
jgi:uncharacterized protein YceK